MKDMFQISIKKFLGTETHMLFANVKINVKFQSTQGTPGKQFKDGPESCSSSFFLPLLIGIYFFNSPQFIHLISQIDFLLPLSCTVFFVVSLVYNVYGHLGFEIYPKGFNKHWFGKWMNTSVSHNLHHQYFKGNYRLYFTIWDRLMGTMRADYDTSFENLKQREKPLPEKWTIKKIAYVILKSGRRDSNPLPTAWDPPVADYQGAAKGIRTLGP